MTTYRPRHRSITNLVIVLALVAAACGSDAPAGQDGEAPSTSASTAAGPAPTDAASTTTGQTDATAEPENDPVLALLDDQVAIATEPWETDWSNATIDIGELQLGIGTIDPRDRIPPIDQPVFETLDEAAEWLGDREPGVLVTIEGESRFYPLSILTRHEIVNDEFGDVPVAVTYCPLCNTALVFDRRVDGQVLRFGVSGLLRNSDLVMWDDASTSLWQQITGEAIVGAMAGIALEPIGSSIVGFGDLADTVPDAVSLSRSTGFGIAYGTNPYVTYSSRPEPYAFFTGELDDRYPALERVVGVSVAAGDKAYPFSVISGTGAINDQIGGTPVAILWGSDTADALDTATIADARAVGTGVAFDPVVDGQRLTFTPSGDGFVDDETGSSWTLLGLATDGPLAGTRLQTFVHRNEFWFAWTAFFPDGAVYEP